MAATTPSASRPYLCSRSAYLPDSVKVSCVPTNSVGGAGAPTEFVGTQDTFTESGKYADLLHKYGLDADGVVAAIDRVLRRK